MEVSLSALPNLYVLGRHLPGRQPLTLFYTGSGFVCRLTSGSLWVHLRADYEQVEPWVTVELNGAPISRFAVPKGDSTICLFRGLTPGIPRTVRLLKDVQAMHDDPAHLLQVVGLCCDDDTEFLPLPAPRLRLEFVGDSITSGEGCIGAQCEEDWVGAFFSAREHYARMTADSLGADWRIVSQSGWGLVSGWDNDPHHCIMPFYEKVCGVAQGARNAALGAQQFNDFSAWPADAVIINLGTNDAGALHNPAWHDPESGESFRQTDPSAIGRAAVRALKTLRRCNPDALLIWAYGMLGEELRPVLESAVAEYRAESGDVRAVYLPLPAATPQTLGARQHPGAECHRQAAKVLTEFLTEQFPSRLI